MRALVLAFALGLALAASAQAAPLSLKPAVIELAGTTVRADARWLRTRLAPNPLARPMGLWQWSHCVPNGGPHDAGSAGWNHPYSDWRGPSGSWGNP